MALTKMVNGDIVELSPDEEAEISAEWAVNDATAKANQYKLDRRKDYPTIADQLDYIYHNGLDGWVNLIKMIKLKHPKPQ